MKELFALHKHWCAADAVMQTVRIPVHDGLPSWPTELLDLAQKHSAFLRIAVWYSLLYVVVEGYKSLNMSDLRIDRLLANEEMVDALRLFRNATFHYQSDPVGPKLMAFMETENSETWAAEVHAAFKEFFENVLQINEIVRTIAPKSGA